MNKPAIILKKEYISQHPYFTASRDAYQLPDGKIVDPYFVVELPDSVCALALTTSKECVLVKQYRYPVNKVLYELPGGFIDVNEEPQKAVLRELEEETGYLFEKAISLGTVYGNPGVLNNATHLFLAIGGTLTGTQHFDENESITLEIVSLEKFEHMLNADEIPQSLHTVCGYRALAYLKTNTDLF